MNFWFKIWEISKLWHYIIVSYKNGSSGAFVYKQVTNYLAPDKNIVCSFLSIKNFILYNFFGKLFN